MAITADLKLILEAHGTLSTDRAEHLMTHILAGEVGEVELAALLGALAARGETAEEIAGFALALRRAAITLPLTPNEQEEVVDTCGTGGDGKGTFNISTAAALVAAAAGVKVAKHGNRAVTSKCGSADVLEALGIPIDLPPAAATDALREHGFCFLMATAHHPGMRAAMPVRRRLGVRTVFNVLGPLLNPAGARRQVMGVYSSAVLTPVAQAMALLGVQHAMVVHGSGGLDELSLCGASEVAMVRQVSGVRGIESFQIAPEQAGMPPSSMEALAGAGDAIGNAAILRSIFAGERGPRRDVTLLNTAAVLMVAERATDLREGVRLAADVIDSGAVTDYVARLSQSIH